MSVRLRYFNLGMYVGIAIDQLTSLRDPQKCSFTISAEWLRECAEEAN